MANPNARKSASAALARRANRRELNLNELPKAVSSESNCPNLRQPNRQSKIQKRLVA
jgi:ribosomal protein L32